MTDCSLVSNELKTLLAISSDDVEQYDSLVEYAVESVRPLIKNDVDENDVRIIHLCAVKAYYQIALTQCDGMSSFSAGEVSFSMDTSYPDRAKALLDEAYKGCGNLIGSNDFAFEVV